MVGAISEAVKFKRSLGMLNRALDFTEGHSGRIKGWLLCWVGRHELYRPVGILSPLGACLRPGCHHWSTLDARARTYDEASNGQV